MAVPRGSLHRHWTPGARGPGSEGLGGQGCCTNRLLESGPCRKPLVGVQPQQQGSSAPRLLHREVLRGSFLAEATVPTALG